MRAKHTEIGGWGRHPRSSAAIYRPERRSELAECKELTSSWIPRGAGRSYGDQSLNRDGAILLTTRLDRLVEFDEVSGRLVAEPGVDFHTLHRVFGPRGWQAPVCPGTGYVTLGGALANDVHGKNHDRSGSFGNHVAWFDLLLPSGETKHVTPDSEPALFAATIGGCGLTGLVTKIALDLAKISSNALEVKERRVTDLDDFIARLSEARDKTSYSVGWIDGLAQGRVLGRGILQTAEPALQNLPAAPSRRIPLPINLPSFVLSRGTMQAFNGFYYARVKAGGRTRIIPTERFLYPLDAILNWNRLYGKRGFQQFQCVIPNADAPAGLRRLLETISAAGAASFLAVLKTLGQAGRGYLSFPGPGFTLALDFPCRNGSAALLAQLERITLDHGGRIYLAKDSALLPSAVAAMYPDLPKFQAVLRAIDPNGKLDSDMARRLGLRG